MIILLLSLFFNPFHLVCHTTALIKLQQHHEYSNNEIYRIIERIFPSSTFVICGERVVKGGIEVDYGISRVGRSV